VKYRNKIRGHFHIDFASGLDADKSFRNYEIHPSCNKFGDPPKEGDIYEETPKLTEGKFGSE